MDWCDDVPFPAHCKPLPPDYRIVQLDSGHFLWVQDGGTNENGGPAEGCISVDRWWVRRCAFAHFEAQRFIGWLVFVLSARAALKAAKGAP